MKDLAKLAREMYKNKNFSHNGVSGSDAMRNVFFETLGIDENTDKRDAYTAYQKNKHDLFRVFDAVIDATVPKVITNEFENLAEVHNVGYGESKTVRNPDPSLFRVAQIAAGTQDLRRQTSLAKTYEIETQFYGIKVYEEFDRFLYGEIDWSEYVDRVALSFANFIGERTYEVIAASYPTLAANLKVDGAGQFDVTQLHALAKNVMAESNSGEASVYGTELALSKIDVDMSDAMRDEKNKVGYLGTIQGLKVNALPSVYKAGTKDFVVDDNTLLVVPTGAKLVDIVLEGDTITDEKDALDHNSLQMEFFTRKKIGIQARQASKYGIYQLA